MKWLLEKYRLNKKIKELQNRIESLSICYLTGAGVSVPSGIRPFRGKDGIYEEIPDLIYKLRPDSFESDPDFLYNFHEKFRIELENKYPNKIHELIAKTAQSIITQNIDDLHEKSGFKEVIHVHGDVQHHSCRVCLEVSEGPFKMNDSCKFCQTEHKLRHHVVLFKEGIINQKASRRAMHEAQVLIAIGTSGSVYPVAMYPQMFEGIRICINETLPANAHMFDAVLIGNTEKILEQLLKNKLK